MSRTHSKPHITGLTGRALHKIYDHVFENDDHEVAGVLVGRPVNDDVQIFGSIAAHAAHVERDSVTFTHDAWELIYRELDTKYAGEQIVGWYHSHPGFGIFFSGHDAAAHSTSFNEPWQVALVIDPREGTQGVFGWNEDGEIEQIEYTISTLRPGTGGSPRVPVEPFAEEAMRPSSLERAHGYDLLAIAVPFLLGLLLTFLLFAALSGDDGSDAPAPQPPAESAPTSPNGERPRSERETSGERDRSPRREERSSPGAAIPDSLPTKEFCERALNEGRGVPAECQELILEGVPQP